MSHVNVELEQIRTARDSLQKLRSKLLRPSVTALESGSADLVTALECIKRVELLPASPLRRSAIVEQALRLELSSLRHELQQVNALMDSVGKFYEGWSRLVSCATDDADANYTCGGKSGLPPLHESKNVVIHG